MVPQAKICVPSHNKALSKLQDLCTYPLWSPPVGVIFSKVQVPKILVQFPSEASKNRSGKLALIFKKNWYILYQLIVQKETRLYKRFLLA
jgi:hypothetical protein